MRCPHCGGNILRTGRWGLDASSGYQGEYADACLQCGREPAPQPEPDPWQPPASTTVRSRGRPVGSTGTPHEQAEGFGARFTESELAELRAARAAGVSLLKLAVRYSCTTKTIVRALKPEYTPRAG